MACDDSTHCAWDYFCKCRRQLFLDGGIWMAAAAGAHQRPRTSICTEHHQGWLPLAADEVHQPSGRILIDCKSCPRVCSGTARPDHGRHYLVPSISQSVAGTIGDGYRGHFLRGDAASRLRKLLCRYVCEHLLEVEPLGL